MMRPFLAVAAAALVAAPALAHGVDTTVGNVRAVTVTVTYEDGSPLAFESCEVSAPGDGPAFQVGHTDRLGRVVFVPDRPGRWTVKVTGEDGHGAVVPVTVDAAMVASGAAAAPAAGARGTKLVTGVGVLLGVFGIVALTLRRRT